MLGHSEELLVFRVSNILVIDFSGRTMLKTSIRTAIKPNSAAFCFPFILVVKNGIALLGELNYHNFKLCL